MSLHSLPSSHGFTSSVAYRAPPAGPSGATGASLAGHRRAPRAESRPTVTTLARGAQPRRRGETRRPRPSYSPPEEEPVEAPAQQGWLWQSMSSGDTRQRLRQEGIRAKKSLGQNFLTDDSILQRIVASCELGPGDRVLEVGPGTGNLTRHLLATGAHVAAVEKDTVLYGQLREGLGEPGSPDGEHASRLALVNGDILRVSLPDLAKALLDGSAWAGDSGPGPAPDGQRIKVVTNLPYNITTDFLKASLPLGDVASDLYVMLQHEAAERLTVRVPGGSDYRSMNIRCLLYSTPEYLFGIPREAYYPSPNVDSAMLRFPLRDSTELPSLGRTPRQFYSLVNQAFSSRRKMMKNNLKGFFSTQTVDAALNEMGLDESVRAQELTWEQFVQLSNILVSGLQPAGSPRPEFPLGRLAQGPPLQPGRCDARYRQLMGSRATPEVRTAFSRRDRWSRRRGVAADQPDCQRSLRRNVSETGRVPGSRNGICALVEPQVARAR